MEFKDFIEQFKKQYDVEKIKKEFKDVYFIIGTAYAGKSTMVKKLSENFDGIMCKENYVLDSLDEYGANPTNEPNLFYTKNHTMKEFVNRTPDEYYNWFIGSIIETTSIEIWQLLKIISNNPDKKIFVDTNIPVEILKLISDYEHVTVMLSEKSMSVDNFFKRDDFEKQMIYRAIKRSENPESTMANYKKILEKINSKERYDYFLNSGFYVFKRDDSLNIKQTMNVLAKHFNLKQKINNSYNL